MGAIVSGNQDPFASICAPDEFSLVIAGFPMQLEIQGKIKKMDIPVLILRLV